MKLPSYPAAVSNPRELPELRAALVETACTQGPWHAAETQKLLMDITGPEHVADLDAQGRMIVYGPEGHTSDELARLIDMAVWQANNTVRWYRETLPAAQLIHITPEMTDFIVAAADAVPPDLTLTMDDAPAPAGLVVFGKPVMGTDAGPERGGDPVRVDAVLWGEAMLPNRDVPWYDPRSSDLRTACATLAMFRMVDPFNHTDELARSFARDRILWIPLGRTDWPWGDRLDVKPTVHLTNENPAQWGSMMEDRRLMAALWAVLNQKRLITSYQLLPNSHVRKRLARTGQKPRDESVQIVHLRRTEAQTLRHTDEEGRHVSVRFMVRPHYRRQAWGPGRSLRKLVLVPAHWRGPEDAPVSHAERIWEVDR